MLNLYRSSEVDCAYKIVNDIEEEAWMLIFWKQNAEKLRQGKKGNITNGRILFVFFYLKHLSTLYYQIHSLHHPYPLCEGSFFGLGSVLASSCFGDRLVDGLVKAAALPVSIGDPWDLLVFCCFSRVLCVV